jgi:hypothetical protein
MENRDGCTLRLTNPDLDDFALMCNLKAQIAHDCSSGL